MDSRRDYEWIEMPETELQESNMEIFLTILNYWFKFLHKLSNLFRRNLWTLLVPRNTLDIILRACMPVEKLSPKSSLFEHSQPRVNITLPLYFAPVPAASNYLGLSIKGRGWFPSRPYPWDRSKPPKRRPNLKMLCNPQRTLPIHMKTFL